MGLVGMSKVVPELVGITGQSMAIPDIYAFTHTLTHTAGPLLLFSTLKSIPDWSVIRDSGTQPSITY